MEYPSLDKPIAGAFRFNTDSSQLEIYDGNQWTGLISNPSINVARAIFAGGGSTSDVMQYVNITTTGDAVDFGNLTLGRSWLTAACGNRTRGYWAGGYMSPAPKASDRIDYANFATSGNAIDFGNLSDSRLAAAGCSNETRGLVGGGNPSNSASKTAGIEYFQLSTQGDGATFGNLDEALAMGGGGFGSKIRGFFAGGYAPTKTDDIQYVNFSTLGNTQEFGNLKAATHEIGACGTNATRGIMAGGSNSMDAVMQYITLSTLGNSADFGTISSGGGQSCMGGGSSHIRFVMGGLGSPNANNVIEYVHFSTLGNSIDFGDLLAAQQIGGCASNGHGGL